MIPIPRLSNAIQDLLKETEGVIQKRKEEFLMGSVGYGGAKKSGYHASGSVVITGGSTIASTQFPLQEATLNNPNTCSSMAYHTPESKEHYLRSKQFFKLNSFLYSKYSSSQNYYYIKEVNEILSDSRCVELVRFRQLTDFCQSKEFLQEYLNREQSDIMIRNLTDYYRYHREIPRMFAKSVYDLYFEHHDLKRRVEYVIITKQLKAEKTNEDSKQVAEEKLRKLRHKKYDRMLVGLPEYSFIQKYYHHRESKPIFGDQQSRTCYSIYDKLNKVVNNSNTSKLSGQSFMNIGPPAPLNPDTVQPPAGVQGSLWLEYPGFGPQQFPSKHADPKGTLLSALFSRPSPLPSEHNPSLGNFYKHKQTRPPPEVTETRELQRIFEVGRSNPLVKQGLTAKRELFLQIDGVGDGMKKLQNTIDGQIVEQKQQRGQTDRLENRAMAGLMQEFSETQGAESGQRKQRTRTLQERLREFSQSDDEDEEKLHQEARERMLEEATVEGTRGSDGGGKKRKFGLGQFVTNPVHKKKISTGGKQKKVPAHTKKQSSDIFSSTYEEQAEKISSTRGRKSQEKYIFTGIRGTFEDEKSMKPRSLSKKKRQSSAHRQIGVEKTKTLGHPENRAINFNFNWTKVNKVLTNPLLINKILVPGATGKVGGKTQRDRIAESSVGSGGAGPQHSQGVAHKHNTHTTTAKNYLDTKSKLVKGYHHKMNSMVVSYDSGPFSNVATKEDPGKPKRDLDVFSRKNSYGELEMKAVLGMKTNQVINGLMKEKESSTVAYSTRPRFISHSKKNSIYEMMIPESLAGGGNSIQHQKKSLAMRKRKKKVASLHNFEPSIIPRMKQDYSTSILAPNTQGLTDHISRQHVSNAAEHSIKPQFSSQTATVQPIAGPSQHKHTKSEPERLFVTRPQPSKKLPDKLPIASGVSQVAEQVPWDQQVTKRFHMK
jgi:hypothetical protein